MRLHATIFGSSAPKEGSRGYTQAQKLGDLLTKKGFRIKNGGYYGTMEASSKGALQAGRKALGFPFAGFDPKIPNSYTEVKKVCTIFERLESLICESDLIVVLPGGLGTLSEITTTWMMLQTGLLKRKPIVCCIGSIWKTLIKSIKDNLEITSEDIALLQFFENIYQFQNEIDKIIQQIENRDSKKNL